MRTAVSRWIDRMPDMASQDWRQQAKCIGMSSEIFFFERNGTSGVRGICDDCPVRSECLEEAISNDLVGWWGGTSYTDRNRIRRERGLLDADIALP